MKYKVILVAFLAFTLAASCLAGQDQTLKIPSTVQYMWVFLQDPVDIGAGSGEEVSSMITPQEFLRDYATYQEKARRNNKKMIVTAETKNGEWVQERIEYRGERLKRARYYNPGIDKVVGGAEFPID
jgi:hypothetical protein